MLQKYFRPEFVIDLEEADSPETVFKIAASRIVPLNSVSEQIVRHLVIREQSGSTSLGDGVAIPHAIIPEALPAPLAIFIRVRKGIKWNAEDTKPVQLIFIVIATEQHRNEYLQLLGEIARVFHDYHRRRQILKARNPEEIFRFLTAEVKPGIFQRYRTLLFLLLAILGTYFLGRAFFPVLELPATGVYEKLGLLKFNSEPWVSRQSLTTAIFVGMILGTLFFWRFRVALAAMSIALLLFLKVMNVELAVEYMSIPTVIFIMAMMALIKWLENIGFFRIIVTAVARRIGNSSGLMLAVLMLFSTILSGFAGEVSGILVTFGLALELARQNRTSPFPYLLALVFATNVGSALTLVGNPIGVYIAFAGGLTFEDFLRWATPVSLVACAVTIIICLSLFRRHLPAQQQMKISDTLQVKPSELRLGWIVFVAVIIFIILHARLEHWLNLKEGTVLVATPIAALAFVIFVMQERGKMLIERGIDWWTILFFMFLFANAACLEHTGVTTKLGYFLLRIAQKLPFTQWLGQSGLTGSSLILLLWFSGITSGFVDNMPIVAALVPIVKTLVQIGLPHSKILWWSLLIGGCYGGNLTMIGSSANLVAIGAYEKYTGRSINFGQWIGTGIVITVITLLIATIILLIQLPFAP
ncbi:MAG: SLC13 family permease [candidate division WOR-3 bacterium]|uniref:PTS EIIA type-2 domain-containing protein n=1 Tax=candidate division WOR-3 bacterium TaxID=2052148 RepID=A0A7C3F237_UNCW3|nr:SLC13 family permease [candidate division WOR-3 bacterium]